MIKEPRKNRFRKTKGSCCLLGICVPFVRLDKELRKQRWEPERTTARLSTVVLVS